MTTFDIVRRRVKAGSEDALLELCRGVDLRSPGWYRGACLAFDVVAAAYLVRLARPRP